MGEQSAPRLEGDRYQHLYSWYEVLQLLDEKSPYEYAWIEHPRAGAADDLTLHPKPSTGKPKKFFQIKWHVDHRASYTFDSLVEAISGQQSLLQKLFTSWLELKQKEGSVEIWLVSNWSAHPDLGQFIRARGYSLDKRLFQAGARSVAARIKECWRRVLEATEAQLEQFCNDLRLRLGFAGISDLEERVDDRMARYGLRVGPKQQAAAINEIAARIEQGGDLKRLTREALLEIIQKMDLHARTPETPAISLWIHAWEKQQYGPRPTAELDWTKYFEPPPRRKIPDQHTWETRLFPALRRVKRKFTALAGEKYIDLRGKLPLSVILAVGFTFPQVGGYSFRWEQPSEGRKDLWKSTAKATGLAFQVTQEQGANGPDLLVALAITGDSWLEVQKFYQASPKFNAVVYAAPAGGTGSVALKSDGDAMALAISAKDLLRRSKQKYQADRIHLVLYGPAGFSLFLGQWLNALGDIVTYERNEEGGYQSSVLLNTG
jgi:hypothetical protein